MHLNQGFEYIKFTLLSMNVLVWSRISLNMDFINCHSDAKCNYSFGIFFALMQV